MVVKDENLYRECFEASANKERIKLSHLPFQNGYYITEYGIILKVVESNIFRLEAEGWVPAQQYFDLWYDSMTDFSDIPEDIVKHLKLDDYKIMKQFRK